MERASNFINTKYRTAFQKILSVDNISTGQIIKLLSGELFPSQLFKSSNPLSLLEPYLLDKSAIFFSANDLSFPVQNTNHSIRPFSNTSRFCGELMSHHINRVVTAKAGESPDIPLLHIEVIKRELNINEDDYILYVSPLRTLPGRFSFECIIVNEPLWEKDIEKRVLKFFLSVLNFFQTKSEVNPQTENYSEARSKLRDDLVVLRETVKTLQKLKNPAFEPYNRYLLQWTDKVLDGKYFEYFSYKLKEVKRSQCLGFNLVELRKPILKNIHQELTNIENPTSMSFIADIEINDFINLLVTPNLREYCQRTDNFITWTAELKYLFCFIDYLKKRMPKNRGVIALIDESACFRYPDGTKIKIHGSQNLPKLDREVSPEIDKFFRDLFRKK